MVLSLKEHAIRWNLILEEVIKNTIYDFKNWVNICKNYLFLLDPSDFKAELYLVWFMLHA